MARKDLSFIIPVKDENETISILSNQITRVCKTINMTYEIIFIDDGSIDSSFKEIKKLSRKNRKIRGFRLRGNFGKSIALSTGFSKASADIIFTLDGDLQDDPREIPLFLKKMREGYDLVSGWKRERHDPLSKTLPSKIGNALTRFLTGVKIHDLNCGFKAYKKEVVRNLDLHGELYKFIPIIAQKQNFKVSEVIVQHHPRLYGKSKFGWERNLKGLLDLITIVFLTGYLRRPSHFFGTLGFLFFLPGFLIGLYITYLRITTGTIDFRYPLLFLGALLMIVGIQFISTGLLAEMIITTRSKVETNNYIVEKT